jgi:hypothetical protein
MVAVKKYKNGRAKNQFVLSFAFVFFLQISSILVVQEILFVNIRFSNFVAVSSCGI